MQELLGILCNEKTDGLSLERAKIFGKVWRSCLPEDSDEKTRKLLRSKTWLDMLDALRDDILSVLDSVGKSTDRPATHKEVMLKDDGHVPVTSIVDSKMQKAWTETVRDDIIKACAVLEENAILASLNTSEQAKKNIKNEKLLIVSVGFLFFPDLFCGFVVICAVLSSLISLRCSDHTICSEGALGAVFESADRLC
jgi:hypothetical protein